MPVSVITKASIAAAIGIVFSAASGVYAPATAADGQVKCYGVNSCQGRGACKSGANGCSGENACKGQGYLYMSAAKCKAKGGKIGG